MNIIKSINIIAHKIGIDHDALCEYASAWTGIVCDTDAKGKKHILKKLSMEQLYAVARNLQEAERGIGGMRRTDAAGRVVVMVQKQQIKQIAALGYSLKWPTSDIRSFISRQTRGRVRDWNDLTLAEASGVIVGMEKILGRQAAHHG